MAHDLIHLPQHSSNTQMSYIEQQNELIKQCAMNIATSLVTYLASKPNRHAIINKLKEPKVRKVHLEIAGAQFEWANMVSDKIISQVKKPIEVTV